MSTVETPVAPSPVNGQQLATAPRREVRVVQDNSPLANLLDTARFEHMYRIAESIARSSLTPKHLLGHAPAETAANCFRVVNQAVRWGMDPFAVVDETYVVGGKLGYQGKLVAAVVNARGGLVGRLRCTYSGAGQDRTITVLGRFDGETDERAITLSVKQAKTANKMWENDPDQKLWYSGVTKWARRHCPEILLGVLTDDDLERVTVDVQSVAAVDRALAGPVASGMIEDPTGAHAPIVDRRREQAKAPEDNPADEVEITKEEYEHREQEQSNDEV